MILSACSALPAKYIEQAEPGVTLTALTGHFWVTAATRQQLPPKYRQWARMTVVGRVIGTTNQEPVLLMMYVRGWDFSGGNDEAWESSTDPAYVPMIPEGLHGEFQAH